mgnify:FL=1
MRIVEVWLGEQRCAIPVGAIDEVLPVVEARKLSGTPDWIVGVARLRGAFVPLLDASLICTGKPIVRTMNARVILLQVGAGGGSMRLALLVDRVGSLLTIDFEASGTHPGILGAGRGALTCIAADAAGDIYLLDPSKIVDEENRKLFRDAIGSA